MVAMALVDWGGNLFQLGDSEGAIGKYDEVIARYSSSDSTDLQRPVLEALLLSATLRAQKGDLQKASRAYEQAIERAGRNVDKELSRLATLVPISIGISASSSGRANLALQMCSELNQWLPHLPDEQHDQVIWQELHLRTNALLALGRLQEALEAFRDAYDVFLHSDQYMMHQLPKLVVLLVRAGAPAKTVLAVLIGDQAKAAALTPLLVALHLHAGETVRAPEEVLQVANDILVAIYSDP